MTTFLRMAGVLLRNAREQLARNRGIRILAGAVARGFRDRLGAAARQVSGAMVNVVASTGPAFVSVRGVWAHGYLLFYVIYKFL
jgi:hypothetical protein